MKLTSYIVWGFICSVINIVYGFANGVPAAVSRGFEKQADFSQVWMMIGIFGFLGCSAMIFIYKAVAKNAQSVPDKMATLNFFRALLLGYIALTIAIVIFGYFDSQFTNYYFKEFEFLFGF